jgi:membrane-associated phospholipid phosphatase
MEGGSGRDGQDGNVKTLTRESDTHMEATPLRARGRWVFTQAALVGAAVFVYFGVRGLTEGSRTVAEQHGQHIVHVEQQLGIYVERGVNAPFADPGTLQTLANWVYIWGHWPVIIATMLWLAFRHGHVLLRLRDAMVVSGALGMVIMATYPVAPPRLVDLGLVDTVTETSTAYRVLQPPGFTNQYAAMPSLHAGWDLLVGIAIITASSSLLLRLFGILMPLLMSVAVVVTANHYVLDVVVGVVLVIIGHWAALQLERRRARRAALPGRAVQNPTHIPGGD